MADLTKDRCGKTCHARPYRGPNRCCAPEYCSITKHYAKDEYGVDLPETGHATLPYMGESGCTVAPHLRPLCTLHDCSINGTGTSGDAAFDEKYFRLREKIDAAEFPQG